MTNISPKGEDNVGRKKQIAHIVERKNAKYNVEYGTDGTKSEQIKKGMDILARMTKEMLD